MPSLGVMASVILPLLSKLKIKYQSTFEGGKFYHIYNRANNQDSLFYREKNYSYFLKKYEQYLSDYLDTFAYCLLPNYFHFMVRVKIKYSSNQNINQEIAEQFRRFFISYSQAINKQEERKGSLFEKPFKRKLIDNPSYFTQLVLYIHLNPVSHGYSDNWETYKWNSFQSIISDEYSKINRKKVLEWFGSKEEFINYHQNYSLETSIRN